MGVACLSLAACHAKILTPSPADALRQQVTELEAKNAVLEAQVEELRAQFALKNETTQSPSVELEQATPRAAKLTIGNLSRALPKKEVAGKPTQPEKLVIFVSAMDARGQALQLTGDLTIEASLQSGANVAQLAVAHWGPLQLRDAYRGGFGSPHYSLETPIVIAPDMLNATALVVVTYRDGWTGRTLKTERAIPWPIDEFNAEIPPNVE